MIVFNLLGHLWNTLNTDAVYVIDSLPVMVCDKIRIARSKLYPDKKFRGYIASKRRYFYGVKIHLMVTQDGQPVELFLTHGGFGDVDALKCYTYNLPVGQCVKRMRHEPARRMSRLCNIIIVKGSRQLAAGLSNCYQSRSMRLRRRDSS
jgi:hypothetical protein